MRSTKTILGYKSSQRKPKNPLPKLPWPLPERPARVHVCASPLAAYSIVLGIEAWDKADPRAVAFFRCQRHARGRAFPDTLLLERIPIAGLTRECTTVHVKWLIKYLRGRARADAICVGAQP